MSDPNVEVVDNVTYVGGQAAEQETSGDVSDAVGDERAAAKEAVRKAWEAEGKADPEKRLKEAKDVSTDETEEAPEEEKPKAKAKPEEDEDALALKNAMRNREKLAKAKAKQNEEIQKVQQEMQNQWRQLQQQKAYLEQEARKFEKFKKDPVAAFQELYGKGREEEFILGLAQQNTPEGRQAALLKQMQDQIQEQNNWRQEQLRQQQEAMVRQQQHQEIQYRQHIEQRFNQHAFNEEKHPHLATFYAGREQAAIAEGDLIAMKYQELTGNIAQPEEIAEYMEELLAERAEKLYKKRIGEKVGQPAQAAPVVVPKGNKGKSLTPAVTSQRNGGARSMESLDGEERLQAAREAVKAAFAAEQAKQRG